MKTYRLLARLGQPLTSRVRRALRARRGTVIIVVLALLGMLALLGFFVFAYTASENQAATYFDNSPSAKVPTPALDPDTFFNNVLRQIIIGPAAIEKQSALWGGRASLVPTMFGRDLSPYNGGGVNLFWNVALNQASVDQNYDQVPDDGSIPTEPDNRALTFLNLSPAAAVAWQASTAFVTGAFVRPNANAQTNFLYIATTPGTSGTTEPTWGTTVGSTVTDGTVTWTTATSLDLNNYPPNINPLTPNLYPDPDVNSTYPDINSAFLSYDALVPATFSGSPQQPVRVLTPSYHRPQFLRNATAHGGLGNVPLANWYVDPLTAPLVMYPHVEHTAIDYNGNITTAQRFVTYAHPDTSTTATTWAANTAYTVGQLVQPITPPPVTSNYLCTQAGTSGGTAPVWPTAQGSTVTDGTVIWSNISLQAFTIPGDSNGTTTGTTTQPPPAEGVWSATAATPLNPAAPPTINYAVDTDNDGILDANYIDVGFPLMTTPTGTQFVAMPAIKIIDADALYNLNAHGNRSGSVVVPAPGLPTNPFGGLGTLPNTTQFISHSNLGLSASEVNIEWAFNATPVAGGPDFTGTPTALATALQQYTSFFRSPAQSTTLPADNHSAGIYELANMEWWNILNGRPQLTPSATPTTTPATVSGSSLPGRWGENLTRLDPNVQQVLAGTTVQGGLGTPGGDPWPLPGTSGGFLYTPPPPLAADDNNNYAESGQFQDEQGVIHPAFGTPLDVFAAGSWVTGTEGKVRQLVAQGAQKYAQYTNYFTNNSVLWTGFFSGGLMSGGGSQFLIDEPDETFLEPSAAATQSNDNIFGAGENVLQLQGADFSNFGSSSRSASLASFNLSASTRAPQIRQRFTSVSWDLKSFGKEFLGAYSSTTPINDARRLWEFTDTSGSGIGPFRFPPDVGGAPGPNPVIQAPAITVLTYSAYPLRPDVAHLLWTLADPKQQLGSNALLMPQHPLSVNGLTEQIQTGTDNSNNPVFTFRIRPLMPHPTATNPPATLPNTAIVPPSHNGIGYTISTPEQLQQAGGTVQQQEWLARYDRQRLARDIYSLLYLTGGGYDNQNYATASNQPIAGVRPIYTDDQLQEMAQFAVNLVDQLDPDSNITVFEYDKDLSNGWNLDDNAYDGVADTQPPFNIIAADRGVVYGVERQQLAFNEAMIAFLQQAVDTTVTPNVSWDHPDTQWNDRNQWAALYLELDNVGPSNVNFVNEQWEIAIKQSPIVTLPSTFYGAGTANSSGERRLIFKLSQPQLVAGAASGGFKPRMTIGGLVGSVGGVTYDQINGSTANPAIPNPSYLVIDPNDTSGAPSNTGFDYQFPIAPRAAYVSPAAPPFGVTTALDLDLTQTGTDGQYWIVPPNAADPTGNADGSPNLITTPVGLSPGTQLLNFTDPITEVTGTISSAIGAHIFPESALILRVELRRRVDPNRAPILPTDPNVLTENADNPWIVVDHMDVPVSVLALKKTGNASDYSAQIQNQLGSTAVLADPPAPGQPYHHYISTGGAMPLVSTERSQPLYHDFTLNPFNPNASPNAATPQGPYITSTAVVYPRNGGVTTLKPNVWQGNSLGQDNDAAGFDPGTVSGAPTAAPPHPLYQPHYDRDFASVIELFNVPTWGPYGPASPTLMNIPGVSAGSSVSLASGLTHLMATRTNEAGTAITAPAAPPYTQEVLAGSDFVPNDTGAARQHYNGYGIGGYRLQHPEGGGLTPPNPAADVTENRWHRLLGLVEVPTRSHRQLEEPPYQITAGTINGSLGFYRTPGKINLNTVRHPDVLAGLLDENDIYGLLFSTQFPTVPPLYNLPSGLQVPFSLPDQNGDTVVNPPISPAGANVRDWWLQFLTARDGVDPLPPALGGTNMSIPGLPRYPSGTAPPTGANVLSTANAVAPGSHPFRGMGFSAYASAPGPPGSTGGGEDTYGYNNTLDSNILRALTGDQVTPPATAAPANSPDARRRIFEVGLATDHAADVVDYATKGRVLSKILQNTTTRSNVFFVWIQIDFFQARDINPPNGVVRIGAKLPSSPGYREFFVIDRSQALSLMGQQYLPSNTSPYVFSTNQSFNYQSLVLFRQRIQ